MNTLKKFIKKSEKVFEKMKIKNEIDLDNLSSENEIKMEKLIKEFEKIFKKLWIDSNNEETTKKDWEKEYKKSKYNFVFQYFK